MQDFLIEVIFTQKLFMNRFAKYICFKTFINSSESEMVCINWNLGYCAEDSTATLKGFHSNSKRIPQQL